MKDNDSNPRDGDLYNILGVERDASQETIRDAYHTLAKKWHPDKNPNNSDEAKKRFQLIADAYQILGDTTKRYYYDHYGLSSAPNDTEIDDAIEKISKRIVEKIFEFRKGIKNLDEKIGNTKEELDTLKKGVEKYNNTLKEIDAAISESKKQREEMKKLIEECKDLSSDDDTDEESDEEIGEKKLSLHQINQNTGENIFTAESNQEISALNEVAKQNINQEGANREEESTIKNEKESELDNQSSNQDPNQAELKTDKSDPTIDIQNIINLIQKAIDEYLNDKKPFGLFQHHGKNGRLRAEALKNQLRACVTSLDILGKLREHLARKEHVLCFWEHDGNLHEHSLDTFILKSISGDKLLHNYLLPNDKQNYSLNTKKDLENFRKVIIEGIDKICDRKKDDKVVDDRVVMELTPNGFPFAY